MINKFVAADIIEHRGERFTLLVDQADNTVLVEGNGVRRRLRATDCTLIKPAGAEREAAMRKARADGLVPAPVPASPAATRPQPMSPATLAKVAIGIATASAAAAALGALLGCAHVRPGVETGTRLDPGVLVVAWRALDQAGDPPPVRVVKGECPDPNGGPGIRCGVMGHGPCRSGCTTDPWAITIVDETAPLAARPLCHEYIHLILARDGVLDPAHALPVWDGPQEVCKIAVGIYEERRR